MIGRDKNIDREIKLSIILNKCDNYDIVERKRPLYPRVMREDYVLIMEHIKKTKAKKMNCHDNEIRDKILNFFSESNILIIDQYIYELICVDPKFQYNSLTSFRSDDRGLVGRFYDKDIYIFDNYFDKSFHKKSILGFKDNFYSFSKTHLYIKKDNKIKFLIL